MDNHSSFSRWFRSEVAISFSVGVAVAAVVLWLTGQISPLNTQIALLQQDVSNIKNNDLTHIELEITAINTKQETFQTTQITQGQQLTEVLTLLKQK